MEDRLRSRLASGLMAEVVAPELETRMAILERRASWENADLPPEVVLAIAGMIESKQLVELPIPGRNFMALVNLTPGVTGTTANPDVFQAQAGVNQARLRIRERLTSAFQRYQNARRQVDLFDKQILPDARTALEQPGRAGPERMSSGPARYSRGRGAGFSGPSGGHRRRRPLPGRH